MNRRSNLLYVFSEGVSSDLLFWVVVSSLFLTTVKGMSSFEVILIALIGAGFSLLLYPLISIFIRKVGNYWSCVTGAALLLLSIILYTVCNTVYGFCVAAGLYEVSFIFMSIRSVMLKNNLKEQGKSEDFVKWRSYSKLVYAVVTCVISLVTGYLFNVYTYLPQILSISCAFVGLILTILYRDSKTVVAEKQTKFDFSLMKNGLLQFFIIFTGVMLGVLSFCQTKTNLLMQLIMTSSGVSISKVSVIISWVVVASRIVRILSIVVFNAIYAKKRNSRIYMHCFTSMLLFAIGIFCVGANVKMNTALAIVCVGFALLVVCAVRDPFAIIKEKVAMTFAEEHQQSSLFSLMKVYNIVGKVLISLLAMFMTLYVTLNYVYLAVLPIAALIFIFDFVFWKLADKKAKKEEK